jgi:hypothetical protein
MSLASGYDPNPLYPIIYINSYEEIRQYTYESAAVVTSPTQDFNMLPNWTLHVGVNSDSDYFEFYIQDDNLNLINGNTRKDCSLDRGWTVQLLLSKSTADTPQRWFYGRIQSADVLHTKNSKAVIRVYCQGWIQQSKKRLTKMQHFQDKLTDGVTIDPNDNDAKVGEIIKRLVTRRDHYVLQSLPLEQQTGIPELEAFWTMNGDLEDKFEGTHSPTQVPERKDSGAVDADRNAGYNATTINTMTGNIRVQKFTGLSPRDKVDSLKIDVNTAAGNVRIKCYDDNAGEPNNLLGESGSLAVGGTGEQTFAYPDNVLVPDDGIIWVGFECDSDTLDIDHQTALTSGTTKTVAHTYGAGADPFGSATNQTYGDDLSLVIQPTEPNTDFESGVAGKMRTYDGATYDSINDSAEFDKGITDPFSVSFWIKKPDTATLETVFAKSLGLADEAGFKITVETDDKIQFKISNGSSSWTVKSATSVPNDVLTHVVCTKGSTANQDDMRIYFDGSLDATGATSTITGTITNNDPMTIGADGSGTDFFTGALGHVMFHSHAHTTDQVRALYAIPFRTTELQDVDVKLEGFKAKHNSFAFAMERLASLTGGFYGMDSNRRLFYYLPNQSDSGFLFTNDQTGSTTTNWNQNKIALLREKNPLSYSDSIRNSGKSVVTALGATESSLDIDVDPTLDAAFDLSANYLAIQFVPTNPSLNKVAFKLRRKGDPLSSDLVVRIVGATGTPSPRVTEQNIRVIVPKEKLNQKLASSQWVWIEVGFKKRLLVADATYYCVLDKQGSSSSKIEVGYATAGATESYFSSSDGSSWGVSNTGDFAFRTFPTAALNLIMFNADAFRKNGLDEAMINLRGVPSLDTAANILFGLAPIIGSERRVYPPIPITPTTDPIPTGQFCTIFDSFLDISVRGTILGYDLKGNETISGGCNEIQVIIEEFSGAV